MRDAGLNRAIDAAGGIAQLARKIGIAQPSVSNWNRVPAERVIAVEAATGVSRKQLRPDLYSELAVPHDGVDPVDAGRAQEYALLAALLSLRRRMRCSARSRSCATMQLRLVAPTPRGRGRIDRGRPAKSNANISILFVGLARGELLPYASYYLTGFLNERPLSRLRDDLAALGIERVESNFEPEDHAATLCEVMAGFAAARFPASPEAQRAFFEKHVAPWMGRLFADMESATNARFYRPVGTLGRLFLEIEAEAFTFAN